MAYKIRLCQAGFRARTLPKAAPKQSHRLRICLAQMDFYPISPPPRSVLETVLGISLRRTTCLAQADFHPFPSPCRYFCHVSPSMVPSMAPCPRLWCILWPCVAVYGAFYGPVSPSMVQLRGGNSIQNPSVPGRFPGKDPAKSSSETKSQATNLLGTDGFLPHFSPSQKRAGNGFGHQPSTHNLLGTDGFSPISLPIQARAGRRLWCLMAPCRRPSRCFL